MTSDVRGLIMILGILLMSCSNPSSSDVFQEMVFVTVPPGSFSMGSPEDEPGRFGDEGPLHNVTISYQFEMLSTEVTQRMWEMVMGSNPSLFVGADYPVETVSWDDCHLFLEQLNLLDEQWHYRLPSEAEWEYACRAGTVTPYYSGWEESDLELIGWFSRNSGSTNEAAGQKLPNDFGLYDMNGNVWELCEDYYHDDYEGAPDDGSPWISGGTSTRVARGGSVGSSARRCRSAARDECHQSLKYQFLGFRLVRTPAE